VAALPPLQPAIRGRIRAPVGRVQAACEPLIDDFLSGTSGQVVGIRRTTAAVIADALDDAAALATARRARLSRAARGLPRRRVLALAVDAGAPNLLDAARAELSRSRHDVEIVTTIAGDRGKFENLNALLADHAAAGHDWLIVVDDDVALPGRFLDAFLFLAERFALQLAQPAHRHRSHAAWEVTRRRRASVVRETPFIEIGPVSAFAAATFDVLLPFPSTRSGWGLDLHWAALAKEHGWRAGVIDATPIGHGLRPIAASYDREDAKREAREFLATRPYLPAREVQRTLVTHRSWR
jgi:hypothetical protein